MNKGVSSLHPHPFNMDTGNRKKEIMMYFQQLGRRYEDYKFVKMSSKEFVHTRNPKGRMLEIKIFMIKK